MTWAEPIALIDEFITRYGPMPQAALRELRAEMRVREIQAIESRCSCGSCQRVTPTNVSTYATRPQDWGQQ